MSDLKEKKLNDQQIEDVNGGIDYSTHVKKNANGDYICPKCKKGILVWKSHGPKWTQICGICNGDDHKCNNESCGAEYILEPVYKLWWEVDLDCIVNKI